MGWFSLIPLLSAITCHSCKGTCTGEVLKVQEKHFHINCFCCKSESVVLLLSLIVGPSFAWPLIMQNSRRTSQVVALT